MAKELFFYQRFDRWSAEDLNTKLSELDRSSDITVRLNSPGGDVVGGDAVIAMLNEFTGKKTVIIDGEAGSMAAILLLYFDEVIANDHGYETILFHKAAFSSWYEPTEEDKKGLQKINDSFKSRITKKVSGKIGSEDFIATLFEEGRRNDVKLTAKKAKQLGIVTEVRKIEPTAYSGMSIVAMIENTTTTKSEQVNKPKKEGMEITLEQLETAKKEAYASGVKAEQDRVGAWLALAEIDSAAALKGASDPEAKVTQTVIAQFTVIAMKKTRINAHADDNADNTVTTGQDNPKSKEQVEAEAKQAEIDAIMSLKVTL